MPRTKVHPPANPPIDPAAKNAAAESASRFGCSQGDRRAAAVATGTATVCVPDATTTPDPPATAPEAATVDGAASPNR